MSEPFLAEVRMVGFNFAPRGWAFCDGQILPINQNQSLYSLLGTTYGGDGRTSFALPDLRGRVPIHESSNHPLGQKSGTETSFLTTNELPTHNHNVMANSLDADTTNPAGNVLAASDKIYRHTAGVSTAGMRGTNNAGGGQGHTNMQPCLAIGFCIALQGLFPPRN
jgi:microcystin-dependent protein